MLFEGAKFPKGRLKRCSDYGMIVLFFHGSIACIQIKRWNERSLNRMALSYTVDIHSHLITRFHDISPRVFDKSFTSSANTSSINPPSSSLPLRWIKHAHSPCFLNKLLTNANTNHPPLGGPLSANRHSLLQNDATT
jgi:hypothetical protein